MTSNRTSLLSPAGRGPAVLATSLLIALLGVVVGATAAQAHNVLRSTDPADGSTVATAPDQVTLTFDEPAIALGTQVDVHGPDGSLVSVGQPVLVDSAVSQALSDDRPAGTYTVEWRVTSDDGHPITGRLTFTASAATTPESAPVGGAGDQATATPTAGSEPTSSAVANPSPSATPVDEPGGDSSSGAAVVVAVVIAAAVLSWLLWRRRRPRTQP